MSEALRQRVTFRIDQFEAIANPEVTGHAEWTLKVAVNGIDRWVSPKRHRVQEGDRTVVDASFYIDIAARSGELTMSVDATEHDWGPDDHATGEQRLHRSQNFGGDNFHIDVKGKDAHLRLQCSARIGDV